MPLRANRERRVFLDAPFPFQHPVDLRWLEAFDALYSGDPRPSDVPEMNFWRSVDIYSDHMVRYAPLEASGRTKSFGEIPGEEKPYGFASFDAEGAIYTVVNPAQSIEDVDMPAVSRVQAQQGNGRVLFTDAGSSRYSCQETRFV